MLTKPTDLLSIRKLCNLLFTSQFRINIVSGIITTAANLIVAAVSYPLYLYFLGYEKYGIWLILATVMAFAQLGNMGMGPAITKIVSEQHTLRNSANIESYVSTAFLIILTTGMIILLILSLLTEHIISIFILGQKDADLAIAFLPSIGCLTIYVFIVQVLGSVLSGLGRMDIANYIQTLGAISNLAVAGLFLVSGFDVASLLLGNFVSCFVMHFVTLICIRRIEPLQLFKFRTLSAQKAKRLIDFGGTIFAGSLVNIMLNPFNRIVVSRYAGVSMVPIYEIAFTGSFYVRAFFEAGMRALVPEVSSSSAGNLTVPSDKVLRLYYRIIKLTLLFGIPVFSILFIIAPDLLKLWLAGRYVDALPRPFRIMLVGAFLSLLGVPAYYTLMGLGSVRSIFMSHLIMSLTNLLTIWVTISFLSASISSIVACTSIAMASSTAYLLLQKTKNTYPHLIQ